VLINLTIKNYALIRQLELAPAANLTVVTGETGAGKSIMLGALGLLMGNRADTKMLWNENEKCVTEGTFHIKEYKLKSVFKEEDLDYDDTTVIRREISPGGKSRAFINDTPVTLDTLKRISHLLLDVHSQHETLLLGQQSFQLAMVDAYAENTELRVAYTETWKAFQQAKKEYESLKAEAETLKAEADYIRFQVDELVKANLSDIDQAVLESEVKVAEHAEEIKQRFQAALQLLSEGEYASRTSLSEARALVQQVSSYAPAYEKLFERLNSVLIELDDLVAEVEHAEQAIDFDAERAETTKEQLNTLYRLLKKHRAQDLAELLSIQQALENKAAITNNVDAALELRRKALTDASAMLQQIAKKLSDSRQAVFGRLSKSITTLLKELGIPNATFEFEHTQVDAQPTGIDKIEVLFSANKGIAARPLAQVASGGEFARLMFCIKHLMADKQAMPTLVLDEIDTGVSGEIALKLGDMMKKMARRHQLITISHLPQIAAKGDSHFFVYKNNSAAKTISEIKVLTGQERVEKIAEMIGGAKPSKTALESARELMEA
jgi:DNA repair protein RecN (Recombination protein N)